MAKEQLKRQPASIRVRLAVLRSFGKSAVKHSRLEKNSMEVITLPTRRIRFHDLRHTYASLLIAQGGAPEVYPDEARPCLDPDDARPLPSSDA